LQYKWNSFVTLATSKDFTGRGQLIVLERCRCFAAFQATRLTIFDPSLPLFSHFSFDLKAIKKTTSIKQIGSL